MNGENGWDAASAADDPGTHLLSVLVNDHPGVLQRVCGLFARRNYNVDSISVGPSEQPGLHRIVMAVRGDERRIGQMCSQLHKLIDVLQVVRLSRQSAVVRELMFVKLHAEPAARPELMSVVDTFRCSVVDVGSRSVTIQAIGDKEKNDAFLQLVSPYGVIELTRTGVTAMSRG